MNMNDKLAEALELMLSGPKQEVIERAEWVLKKYRREQKEYREDTVRIEIDFPCKVSVPDSLFHDLVEVVSEICKGYEDKHPGRVMWPAGMGSKILYMPMTREEEEAGNGMKFDDSVLSISCAERADYKAICTKCGMEQGDHKDHILDPPAGNCEFTCTN